MTVAIRTEKEVAEILSGKGDETMLIDARTELHFNKGRLPGSLLLEWEDFVSPPPPSATQFQERGWWGLLEDPGRGNFTQVLEKKGIDFGKELLVYGDGPKSKGREGRLAWMLLYLGAPRVSLFSGGFSHICQHWKITNLDKIPELSPSRIEINPVLDRRCRIEDLQDHVNRGDATIWDGRTEPEFDGEEHVYLPRRGHIPGAVLFSFPSIFQADSPCFIDRQTYLKRLKDLPPRREVIIAYCELGLRASTIAILHEAYTQERVKIFDGGFMQWSLSDTYPVVSDTRIG